MGNGQEPEGGASPSSTIYAGPTKRFFVSMLTRDIELKDAILDLLDNCVDGAMRSQGLSTTESETAYAGFHAKITATPDGFEIKDNCGGIPRDIAEKSAFVLGRPDMLRDADLPTIGMYGIGMKRAIFKMGRDAVVHSNPADGAFSVHYSPAWMDETNDEWYLPIDFSAAALPVKGTNIVIRELVPAVRHQFAKESNFLNELREEIAIYYGYIIQKGFRVELNKDPIKPQILRLLATQQPNEDDDAEAEDAIRPYYFAANVEGVTITVSVGFRRPLPTEMEVDEEQVGPRSSEEAGISIICNDRLVLLNDKTRLTGWGDGGVPRYHNQFIAISGEATFSSAQANKLPLTTTKRGVDASAIVFLTARQYIMEGLKIATAYTYKWKGMEERTEEFFRLAQPMPVRQFALSIVEQLTRVRDIPGARRYLPKLPLPKDTNPLKRISFSRALVDIQEVASYLLDDFAAKPSTVGEVAFDKIHEQAKK
jgi:hypothetical protein